MTTGRAAVLYQLSYEDPYIFVSFPQFISCHYGFDELNTLACSPYMGGLRADYSLPGRILQCERRGHGFESR